MRKLLTILIRRWDTSFHARTHGEEAAKAQLGRARQKIATSAPFQFQPHCLRLVRWRAPACRSFFALPDLRADATEAH